MASQHMDNTEIRTTTVVRPAGAPTGTYADAIVVLALLAATALAVYLPGVNQSIVRFGLAVVLFLFLPGYALVAAIYPGRAGPTGIERLVLSVGMSLVASPLIGFALNYTSYGVTELSMAAGVGAFTLAALAVAVARRALLRAADRFCPDFATPVHALWTAVNPRGKKGPEKAATVMLLASLALVVVTVSFVAAVPMSSNHYTEFYLYGKNSTIAEYPVSFSLGDTKPVIVGIANHEGGTMAYNLVVTIDGLGGGRQQIYSGDFVLADNQTLEQPINLTPDRAGDHMDMQFLLYTADNPDQPYRSCNLWIDVAAPPAAAVLPPVNNSTLL